MVAVRDVDLRHRDGAVAFGEARQELLGRIAVMVLHRLAALFAAKHALAAGRDAVRTGSRMVLRRHLGLWDDCWQFRHRFCHNDCVRMTPRGQTSVKGQELLVHDEPPRSTTEKKNNRPRPVAAGNCISAIALGIRPHPIPLSFFCKGQKSPFVKGP